MNKKHRCFYCWWYMNLYKADDKLLCKNCYNRYISNDEIHQKKYPIHKNIIKN